MNVVDSQPQGYFLLEESGEYYIDVNCEKGFMSFSVLVMLNPSEKMNYLKQGSQYLIGLAKVISETADLNHPRNIKDKSILDESHESVMEWVKLNA
jgi:hypothetical protein